MSDTESKQMKLGEKKKAKPKPITDLTPVDFNTWKIPKAWDIRETAADLSANLGTDLPGTFNIIKNRIEYNFAKGDQEISCLNWPCPGCSKKHLASFDKDTLILKQQCIDKSHAIFTNDPEGGPIQVQMICFECENYHSVVDYTIWKSMRDKRCGPCKKKTAAADAAERKKVKRREKEEEITAQQIQETTIEAEQSEIASNTKEALEELESFEKKEEEITLRDDEYSCSICGIRKRFDLEYKEDFLTCSCGNPIEKPEEDIYLCPHCNACYLVSQIPNDGRCAGCAKHPLLLDLTGKRLSKKKLEELQSPPEEEIELGGPGAVIQESTVEHKSLQPIGEFFIGPQDFGTEIYRLIHPDFNEHFYLTVMKNPVSAMNAIHKQIYWGNAQVKEPVIVYVMNYQSFTVFQITNTNMSTVNEPIPPMQFTQLDESWIHELFPEFESPKKSEALKQSKTKATKKNIPRGDKKEIIPHGMKKDNGTRKELPFVDKEEKKPKQLSLDSFTTMLIKVDNLKTTDFQFRSDLDKEHLEFLQKSMTQKRTDGSQMRNIEAVIVRQIKDSKKYEILSGHHRVVAARNANIPSLKCEVMNIEDAAAVEVAIISNFTRKELSPIEEARALQKYKELTDLSFERIGKRIGKSQPWVSSRIALLQTPDEVQKAIEKEDISVSHVKAVLALEPKNQTKLLKKAVKEGLTSHGLEYEVQKIKREQNEIDEAKKESKKLEKYIDKNLSKIQDKIIGKGYCYDDDIEKELCDMRLSDLLKKAKCETSYSITAKVQKVYTDLLKEKGIKVVNLTTLENKARDEKRETEKLKQFNEEKKDPCKHCEVKEKIIGTVYCPVSDPTKKNPGCKSFWKYSYDAPEFPENLLKICFICAAEFEYGDLIRTSDNYRSDKSVHKQCYFEKLEEATIDNLVLAPCKKCKKRGDCEIQNELCELIEDSDFKISLELTVCNKFKAESEPDYYTLAHGDYWIALLDEDNERAESGLEDIAKFIERSSIDLENISAAEDSESVAALEELKKMFVDSDEKESSETEDSD